MWDKLIIEKFNLGFFWICDVMCELARIVAHELEAKQKSTYLGLWKIVKIRKWFDFSPKICLRITKQKCFFVQNHRRNKSKIQICFICDTIKCFVSTSRSIFAFINHKLNFTNNIFVFSFVYAQTFCIAIKEFTYI